MKKRPATILLSFGLAIAMTACSGSAESTEVDSTESASETAWVDSDLPDTITEDMEFRLQDDFAAAVNKDWKLEQGNALMDPLQEVTDAVLVKMKKAVKDESIQGIEAETLRKYYALSSDWEYRNSQGVEPLKPYIEDIASISSMEDMYSFFGDLNRNPLALAPLTVDVMTDYHTEKYPDINLVAIRGPKLSMGSGRDNGYLSMNTVEGLENYEITRNRVLYMLEKLGYSADDADKIYTNCLVWEKKISNSIEEVNISDDEDKYVYDRKQAAALAGSFPLDQLLNAWGFDDAGYLVISPRNAKLLTRVCKESNLEKIKGYLIVNYVLDAYENLDRETYETIKELGKSKLNKEVEIEGKTDEQKEDELQFFGYINATPMIGALNKVYVDNYYNDEITGDITSLTQTIIDSYKDIFSKEPWLSDEGKALCIEKLENMGIHIVHQNFEVLDYSKVSFRSKEEGGSFLEAYYAAERYGMYHKAFLASQTFSRDFWDPLDENDATTQSNAFYKNSTNGIYICAGVCESYSYSPDMKQEEKLGGVCTIIGHEITHGFDQMGALYDKEGRQNTWLPDKDQLAFIDKSDRVGAYFSTITPYPGSGLYDGAAKKEEATADMGGLKVALSVASGIKDFDYDLFFKSYARLWKCHYPIELEKQYAAANAHPLPYLRINVGLQQFDEFYETYGIKEGDGMYLAPEKRISVW